MAPQLSLLALAVFGPNKYCNYTPLLGSFLSLGKMCMNQIRMSSH